MTEPALHPLCAAERARRGFCLCASQARPGAPAAADASGTAAELPATACRVHPEGRDLPEPQRLAAGLHFYDDRRQRHVAWADAVEAMRQGRYAGAANLALTLFTWLNLMRLLEALHDPFGHSGEPITEARADALVAWAAQAIPVEERRRLLTVARGGGTDAIATLFRMAAQSGYETGYEAGCAAAP